MSSKGLTETDIMAAALDLGVEEATIKAIIDVESSGSGFIDEEHPKILYEAHVMWQRLKAHGFDPAKYLKGNEDVLSPVWNRELYKGGLAEYKRLEKASLIHLPAALESCSWGLFQILGKHWRLLGYRSVQEFVNKQYENEREHLNAFLRYIRAYRQVNYLRDRDFAKFAFHYNGSAYAENHYDTRLAKAYKKFGGKYDAETHT